MIIERIRARRAIERRFSAIGYRPGADTWHQLNLAVARDLQARLLPPNVAVPPRRQIVNYLSAIYRATGSARIAAKALLHAGSWTSSGGSFRLAEMVGVDIAALAAAHIDDGFTLLEVGGGWAGLHRNQAGNPALSIGLLAQRNRSALGAKLKLHFTNLTRWHENLPEGVTEHPHVTAATLSVLATEGVEPASVDLIYSQAAAYFEPDIAAFVACAAALLRPGGQLLFNYPPEREAEILVAATVGGLEMSRSHLAGGMNGRVGLFAKKRGALSGTAGQAARETRAVLINSAA